MNLMENRRIKIRGLESFLRSKGFNYKVRDSYLEYFKDEFGGEAGSVESFLRWAEKMSKDDHGNALESDCIKILKAIKDSNLN